ncbi:cation-transporting ATPase [Brachybacterium sp. YJGR34]|uniref:cation-transporting ATPase n=1 Tax=Brachybacterium sp. YJGR34 TaxID=2059911 RepID=UPI000E0BC792|nr:cation-transporting ATPase [Brachybacterium sp. YJGR34]
MSTLRRLVDTAQQALAKNTSGSTSSGGSTDWTSLARGLKNSFTGESSATPAPAASAEDARALARYDYLVRTAEPEQLERVHREAFEKLTPEQRAQLAERMRSDLPEGERPRTDAPQDLARSATRLGALDPRRLMQLLGRSGRGVGLAAGGLLAAVAGGAVVTAVGSSLLADAVGEGIDVDALTGAGLEDFAGIEGIEGLPGFGDAIGDLGLGDFLGR